MILLQLSDFRLGKYDIPDAIGVYTNANVQEIIDKYEAPAIYQLLGVVLGNLVIAYIQSGAPPPVPNTDYDKIINPFSEDNPDHCGSPIISSLGMKEYLKAAVFYEYVKNALVNSQAGVVNPDTETARKANPAAAMRYSENKFNDLLDTIEAIQWYCKENETAFPDFNGQRIVVKAAQFFI